MNSLYVDTDILNEKFECSSFKCGFFVTPQQIRQDEDYFACDDSVIRSPTYYTRTNPE